MNFLSDLLASSVLLPHGYCLQWNRALLWSYVTADAAIGLAYYSIPFALLSFVRRRPDVPFRSAFVVFSLFVLACGTTHFLAILGIWRPVYWLDASARVVTAVVSIAAAVLLWRILPAAIRVPSVADVQSANQRLQLEIVERERAEERARVANQELERRVEQRTADLNRAIFALKAEIQERERAEAIQQETEGRYRALIELSPEPVLVHSEGKLVYVNPASARLLGAASPERLIGTPAIEVVVPQQRDVVRQRMAIQLEAGQRVPVMEQKYLRLDGGVVDVEVNSAPISYAGKPAVQVFARDISARKRNEAALRESAARYRRLFENMFEAYARCRLIRENGVAVDVEYLEVNRAFYALTELHEVMGRRITELMPALCEDGTRIIETFERMLRTGEPVRFDVYVKPLDKWIATSAYPLEGDEFVTMFDDITARKRFAEEIQSLNRTLELRVEERTAQLAEKERSLQSIVDAIPGIVGYWDANQVNRFANRMYETWLGTPMAGMQGRTLREVVGEDVYAHVQPYVERALEGVPQHFEFVRHLPGIDATKYLHADYVPDSENGKVKGFLSLAFDVSKLKEAEAAAEAANQAKSEFLASISHEIRTPLNAVLGFAQLGEGDVSGKHARLRFRKILEAGQHLLSLINDILDFSKIEAGKLKLSDDAIDLASIVDESTAMVAQRAEGKGLKFAIVEHPDLPRTFRGDAVRVRQVMLNLLSNAIKFTNQGSVQLELAREAGALVVRVSDTGIGIEARHLERLFMPFEQADASTTRRFGGTGLGLSISQRLVQLMGGTLAVESVPGRGSTFTIRLPLSASEPVRWDVLGQVYIAGLQGDEAATLHTALRARGIDVKAGIPGVSAQRKTLIVTSDTYKARSAAIEALAARGETICAIPIGAAEAPDMQLGDRPYIAFVHGPLSPLRVLAAAESCLRVSADRLTVHRLDGIKVLAADDNELNRVILQEMLEDAGAQVTFAEDGKELVQAFERAPHDFDVVLCDIEMPRMDGYEAARQVKALKPQIPIIGLTAHAFAAARERALQAGMVRYVTKPFTAEEVICAILSTLSSAPA